MLRDINIEKHGSRWALLAMKDLLTKESSNICNISKFPQEFTSICDVCVFLLNIIDLHRPVAAA